MSTPSLNESLIQNQVMLRMQYQSKLKDDAISKATRLIHQLQEEVTLLKDDKQLLKKDNLKKGLEIDQLHDKIREFQSKITFLQDCVNQKEKQIIQLYDSIQIKKEREDKSISKYLTISYEPDRHRSQKKGKRSKNQDHANSDYLNSTQSIGTPTKLTKKKYDMRTSPDEDPARLGSISKQMVDLRRDLQTKDKHNMYLLKKNKAIQDYLSILDDVNHPLLRRQIPRLYRGYLL